MAVSEWLPLAYLDYSPQACFFQLQKSVRRNDSIITNKTKRSFNFKTSKILIKISKQPDPALCDITCYIKTDSSWPLCIIYIAIISKQGKYKTKQKISHTKTSMKFLFFFSIHPLNAKCSHPGFNICISNLTVFSL